MSEDAIINQELEARSQGEARGAGKRGRCEMKMYTAQEMREMAGSIDYDRSVTYYPDVHKIALMLRQAADAEEEMTQLKASKERWMQYQETAAGERNAFIDELREKDAEIAQLKARLEAVVKECGDVRWADNSYAMIDVMTAATDHNKDIDAILRAARGEGGAV